VPPRVIPHLRLRVRVRFVDSSQPWRASTPLFYISLYIYPLLSYKSLPTWRNHLLNAEGLPVHPEIELPIPSSSPAPPYTMPDTPHRARLLDLHHKFDARCQNQTSFGPSTLNSDSTGYRILRLRSARRSDRSKNRGIERKVLPHIADAIEIVEDSFSTWGTTPYVHVARSLGIIESSERTVQRSMADHGVKTYVAAQAKLFKRIWMSGLRMPNLVENGRKKYGIHIYFRTKSLRFRLTTPPTRTSATRYRYCIFDTPRYLI
jgi:hypothetical protein